jgi:hypothetical protein
LLTELPGGVAVDQVWQLVRSAATDAAFSHAPGEDT